MKGHICAKNLICNRLLSEKIAWKYVFQQKLFVFGFFNYRCKNKDLYWYSICKINLRSNEGKLFPQLKFPDLSVSSQLNDQTNINFFNTSSTLPRLVQRRKLYWSRIESRDEKKISWSRISYYYGGQNASRAGEPDWPSFWEDWHSKGRKRKFKILKLLIRVRKGVAVDRKKFQVNKGIWLTI